MLAISSTDHRLFGCPNCGCDTAMGHSSNGRAAQATCESCKLRFAILANGVMEADFSIPTKNGTDWECPRLIPHPRRGTPSFRVGGKCFVSP